MSMKCRECPDYAECVKKSNLNIKRKTCKKAKEKYVMTNADLIRAMNDEELAANLMCPNEMGIADILCDKSDKCDCYKCLLDWLRQSAVEEVK